MKEPTIKDVAAAADVSVTTVSRYLHQQFQKMSPDTRDRIQRAISQLNYHPKVAAQQLRGVKTKLIGVIIADISDQYMALLFKGIYDQMVTAGYQVLVMNSNNDQELERQEIHQLLSKQIDGLIIQPSVADFAAYQMVVDNHVPFVTIDRPIANQPTSVPHVASNNYDSAVQFAELIFNQHGYDNILAIKEFQAQTSGQDERHTGYQAVAAQLNHPYRLLTVQHESNTWLAETIRDHLQHATGKTMIIGLTGRLMYRLIETLSPQQYQYGVDFGLAGYDVDDWERFIQHGITMLHHHPHQIGSTAAQTLLALLTHPQQPQPARLLIPIDRQDRPSY